MPAGINQVAPTSDLVQSGSLVWMVLSHNEAFTQAGIAFRKDWAISRRVRDTVDCMLSWKTSGD